ADHSAAELWIKPMRPLEHGRHGEQEGHMKGTGRAVFVAMLLLMAGTLNIIYGIGAVSNAHFFDNTQYVFSSLHTWGWITIILGIIQLSAGFSLMGGRTFGRVIGMVAASIGALESLRSEEHTSELQSLRHLVCRLLLEKK